MHLREANHTPVEEELKTVAVYNPVNIGWWNCKIWDLR